MEGLGLNI